MAYFTPEQVYDSLVDQGVSEQQALAMAQAMGSQRHSGEALKAAYRSLGIEGVALPSGQHGATDTPVFTNLGDALGSTVLARFGLPGAIVGGMAGSVAGQQLSGENYYDRASYPDMAAEGLLGLGLGYGSAKFGAGIDAARRAKFEARAREMGYGKQLVRPDPDAGFFRGYVDRYKARKANRAILKKMRGRAYDEAIKAAGKKVASGLGRRAAVATGAKLGAGLGAFLPVPGVGVGLGSALGGGLGWLAGGLLADAVMPDRSVAVEDDPNIDRPGPAGDDWTGLGTLGGVAGAAAGGAALLTPWGRKVRKAAGAGLKKVPGVENIQGRYRQHLADARASAELDAAGANQERAKLRQQARDLQNRLRSSYEDSRARKEVENLTDKKSLEDATYTRWLRGPFRSVQEVVAGTGGAVEDLGRHMYESALR